jgi:pilus assembly protein Flp/PilA
LHGIGDAVAPVAVVHVMESTGEPFPWKQCPPSWRRSSPSRPSLSSMMAINSLLAGLRYLSWITPPNASCYSSSNGWIEVTLTIKAADQPRFPPSAPTFAADPRREPAGEAFSVKAPLRCAFGPCGFAKSLGIWFIGSSDLGARKPVRSGCAGVRNQGKTVMSAFMRLLRDESGATAIEYGLIAAGISVAIIAVVRGIGTNLNATFSSVLTALQ